ncbi:MAG: GNAT family N-acetyltransferase [Methyloversatilis discipulorum]|uniref:GNAT family N-acetyltransferase n=1 Tax=Methyloversatilis TaxID=378210 RepID=UPI0026E91C48|nr:GNAT family N-acetyltransferase [Methyloversatilis discipulorum]MBT9516750.1 GNAT family N-acetyltransferase [Methyloversatilis discipulorum]
MGGEAAMKSLGQAISIRRAGDEDLDWLLDMYTSLDFSPEPSLPLTEAQVRFRKIMRYPDYRIFVAECDGDRVGTFALIIVDGLAHGGRPHAVVEDVVVAPGHRQRGVGQAMMRYAMDCCAEAGCYKLALSSHTRREKAHRFYELLGFERHGYSFMVEF